MYAPGTFNALSPGYIRISQNPATGDAGTCYGDSGGPQFLDGLLVSITVTGDTFCKSTNVVQRLDTEQAQLFLQRLHLAEAAEGRGRRTAPFCLGVLLSATKSPPRAHFQSGRRVGHGRHVFGGLARNLAHERNAFAQILAGGRRRRP